MGTELIVTLGFIIIIIIGAFVFAWLIDRERKNPGTTRIRKHRNKKKVLGTIRRGRTKITSAKQMRYLHSHRIDHTHYSYKGSSIISKTRHIYNGRRGYK